MITLLIIRLPRSGIGCRVFSDVRRILRTCTPLELQRSTRLRIMLVNIFYCVRVGNGMDCQICLRRLERFEPVYRMQFGSQINNGWRTSVCSRCLSAFVESLKRPGLRDHFRSPKPCEACARPVYNPKRWTVTRVICSLRCRGIIDTEPAKQRRSSRSFGFLA